MLGCLNQATFMWDVADVTDSRTGHRDTYGRGAARVREPLRVVARVAPKIRYMWDVSFINLQLLGSARAAHRLVARP